ncbi:Signal transduction histidine kinase [Lachnospiraceae bacterium NE2001]|nr:Signal transduction histidine kinase [Lachnospiraceae bacterium NE2001]
MNRFKKASIIIVIAEVLIIIALNIFYLTNIRVTGRYYRVEAERVVRILEAEEAYRNNPENINLGDYSTIVRVSVYDPSELCNNDFVVEEVEGKLYRIEYRVLEDRSTFILMNVGMASALLLTIGVLLYIGYKVIKPFDKMSSLTEQLAKGNLSTPIKEEKSRFFGKFLWGMDMLRENLEDSKMKNLEYQKEKKTMLLSLSHDIKTPLSAIQLYSKALSEGLYDTEEKKQEALAGIQSKTEEIRGYVDEIYKLSREDFMELEVRPGEVYLKDVMDGVVAYYKDKLSVIHTEFEVEEFDNVLLSADKDRLIESLQNLMENAIKYGDGRKISISFSEEEDCKLITVSNTGCTLEDSEINNIFDSFYRGSNTTNIQGNGLGLYIVKQLMTKMDGDVFASKEGENFNVTLVVRKV